LKGFTIMSKHAFTRTVARASTVLGLGTLGLAAPGFASAASAATTSAATTAPAWHVLGKPASNGIIPVVVATGKSTGFAFFEPNAADGAVPVAYARDGATGFRKVSFPGAVNELVVGAAATSQSDVYVFADLTDGKSQVLKWTGTRFSVVATFAGQLDGGTVVAANDVYAFGGVYAEHAKTAGVYHYNGRTWTRISGTLQGDGGAVSARDAFVVSGTIVYSYDGAKWASKNLASLLPKRTELNDPHLAGVVALGTGDVYVIGTGGDQDSGGPAVILRFNGHAWSKVAESSFGPKAFAPDGAGGVWISATGFGTGASALLHYTDGRLVTVTPPKYDGELARVDSISQVPGSTQELAGGDIFPESGLPSLPALVLTYG
jgi:hypothetical protein